MTVEATIEGLFREEWGQIVATLIRMTGDWDLAEECAQDAFAQALQRWPQVPALVLTGSRTGPWAPAAAQAVSDGLPYCRHVVLEGQDHNVSWDALLPHLRSFLD
ncbi:hypothetical protein ACWDRB_17465 [Nonomuraea sp. NPDC003707]